MKALQETRVLGVNSSIQYGLFQLQIDQLLSSTDIGKRWSIVNDPVNHAFATHSLGFPVCFDGKRVAA